ncbi:MAG: aldehyde dehydrogenase family protein [Candidatus Hydrogenedentota bacterium]|nr:MAG: aldehyde dehydrogenase family protein [Candidatus Hydrogenedentota bacterium]
MSALKEQIFPLQIPNAKSTGEYLEVFSAYDKTYLGKVEVADKKAADQALQNASELFSSKENILTKEQRISILKKAAELIAKEKETVAVQAAAEGGKPYRDSLAEINRAIDGLQSCVEVLRTQAGVEIPMGLNTASNHKIAFTHHEPIGVVLAFSAFNHPFNLIVHQVATAVAAGCPVIVKPAESTPLSCFRFVEFLYQAGLPKQYCQPLAVKDLTIAESLVSDPRIAFFSFIGSSKVGWMLRSKLAPGVHCALEHGGAAPVLLAEDANIKEAIPKLVKGGFYHAGQVCVSVQRIFIPESLLQDFVDPFVSAVKELKVGDPTLPDTDVGPLIREKEVSRLEEWIEEAKQDPETKVLCGGKRISSSCFEPTVLLNPPVTCNVSKKEIFGPVVNLYMYSNFDEALDRANALPYAFQSAVFTSSLDTALKAFRKLKAQAVMVNEHTAFRVDWMPFGGYGDSGLGIGGIPYTIKDLQIEKLLVIHSQEL